MAVPGFSISELIQAAGHIKIVYDSFFNKYTNSAAQIRGLAEDIEQFKSNLETHREVTEKHNLIYTGYDSIRLTLDNCYSFLNEYKAVLDTKFSTGKVIKTARYPYDQDKVALLRRQIESHRSNLLHFSMNVVLDNTLVRRTDTTSNIATTQALPIPTPSLPAAITPPRSPSLYFGSPDGLLSASPPASSFDRHKQSSVQRSPYVQPILDSPVPERRDTDLSILVLPQPALPYCVAKVKIGPKKGGGYSNMFELRRKPTGRDVTGGRELAIIDEGGNPRLNHRIKLLPNQDCYPYTWHSRWKDHRFEVTFKGGTPDSHSLMIKGRLVSSEIPCYTFTEDADYREFQGEVRGKNLVDLFEVRQIKTASSSKNGEATDQHLKIWSDRSQRHSISFYASATEKPRDLEFPLSVLKQEPSTDGLQVILDFTLAVESKRRFSRAFSRSPTDRSISSTATTTVAPSTFSHTQTGLSSSTAPTTPRMSVASFGSSVGQTAIDRSKGDLSTLESLAKQMRYLKIEFSSSDEATRFCTTYNTAYRDEISRPPDLLLGWSLDTEKGPGSTGSWSSPGTPFNMSPVLKAQPG